MSSFTSPLDARFFTEVDKVQLLAEFDYHVGSEASPDIIHVPKGFVTDLASTPFFVWSLGFPKWGRHSKAAVVHDYLYQSKLRSRAMADLIFLEAMCVLRVPLWKRILMYMAVRIIGWWGYKKNNLPENE